MKGRNIRRQNQLQVASFLIHQKTIWIIIALCILNSIYTFVLNTNHITGHTLPKEAPPYQDGNATTRQTFHVDRGYSDSSDKRERRIHKSGKVIAGNIPQRKKRRKAWTKATNVTMKTTNVKSLQLPKDWTTDLRFFLIEQPDVTTRVLPSAAYVGAYRGVNEQTGEVWLHRGFEKFAEYRTMDAAKADIFLIPIYFNNWKPALEFNTKNNTMSFEETIASRIRFPDKPHVLLTPTVTRKIRLESLVDHLQARGVNLFSLAFERNKMWQHMEADRLIPVPYVVDSSTYKTKRKRRRIPTEHNNTEQSRIHNYVFYSGTNRKMSRRLGGCDRTVIRPLENRTDMSVKLVENKQRLPQEEYNNIMKTKAEYCLILCGDTVTSRSLTSAMVANCIPIRVGTRLRGYCDAPCTPGWGWTFTNGLTHLPYADSIPWDEFPEVDEGDFATNPLKTLQQQIFEKYDERRKNVLRSIMAQVQDGFVYGHGNPIDTNEFGSAISYIWKSLVTHINLVHQQKTSEP